MKWEYLEVYAPVDEENEVDYGEHEDEDDEGEVVLPVVRAQVPEQQLPLPQHQLV